MVLKANVSVEEELVQEFQTLAVLDGDKPSARVNPLPRPHVALGVVETPTEDTKGAYVLKCILCEGRCIGGLSRRNSASAKQAYNATRWIAHLVERCEACPWELKMALWNSSRSNELQKPKRTSRVSPPKVTSVKGSDAAVPKCKAQDKAPAKATDSGDVDAILELFRSACEKKAACKSDASSIELRSAELFIANAMDRAICDVKPLVKEADVDGAKRIDEDKLTYIVRQLLASK